MGLRLLTAAVLCASAVAGAVSWADASAAVGPRSASAAVEPHRVVLGLNTDGIEETTGTALDGFEAKTGVKPGIGMVYRDWDDGWSTALLNPRDIDPMVARGVVPMITWMPMLSDGDDVHQPAYSLARIARGDFDAYIVRAAREAAAFHRPFFLRLAHEMNGSWSPWGAHVDGNTPAAFVAMWRHVVAVFRREGATNVRWVWSPNIGGWNGVDRFASYYPGDAWVDWSALDGYNWGTVRGNRWTSFHATFAQNYAAMQSLTRKPMMIGETATTEAGGSKAQWIRQMAQTLPRDMPRVRALIWFDRDKETDWRVDSSPGALAAFARASAATFTSDAAPLMRAGR